MVEDRHKQIARELTRDWYTKTLPNDYLSLIAAALAAERRRALEEACKVVCLECAKDWPMDDPVLYHETPGGGLRKCDATRIRALIPPG